MLQAMKLWEIGGKCDGGQGVVERLCEMKHNDVDWANADGGGCLRSRCVCQA